MRILKIKKKERKKEEEEEEEERKKYAGPVYNFDYIHLVPNEFIDFSITNQLFFETLLIEKRGKAISYSIFEKRLETEEEPNFKNRARILGTAG